MNWQSDSIEVRTNRKPRTERILWENWEEQADRAQEFTRIPGAAAVFVVCVLIGMTFCLWGFWALIAVNGG